jgi:hypothetical protein
VTVNMRRTSPKRSEYVTSDGLVRVGFAAMSYVRRKSSTLESWPLEVTWNQL